MSINNIIFIKIISFKGENKMLQELLIDLWATITPSDGFNALYKNNKVDSNKNVSEKDDKIYEDSNKTLIDFEDDDKEKEEYFIEAVSKKFIERDVPDQKSESNDDTSTDETKHDEESSENDTILVSDVVTSTPECGMNMSGHGLVKGERHEPHKQPIIKSKPDEIDGNITEPEFPKKPDDTISIKTQANNLMEFFKSVGNDAEEENSIAINENTITRKDEKIGYLSEIEQIGRTYSLYTLFQKCVDRNGNSNGIISVFAIDMNTSQLVPSKSFSIDTGMIIDRREKIICCIDYGSGDTIYEDYPIYELKRYDKEQKKKVLDERLIHSIFKGGILAISKHPMYDEQTLELNKFVDLHTLPSDPKLKEKMKTRIINAFNTNVFNDIFQSDNKSRLGLKFVNTRTEEFVLVNKAPIRFGFGYDVATTYEVDFMKDHKTILKVIDE